MGTATIVGTSNTIYVNTPNTITITPNNINNYFVSNSSPVTYMWKPSSITTKNSMSGGKTRYFHFYIGPDSSTYYLYLGTYSAKTVAGKSFTNITPINNSNNVFGMTKCKIGDIANLVIRNGSSAAAKIIVVESSSPTDLQTKIGNPVAVGYTRTLSGFTTNTVECNFTAYNPDNIPQSKFGLIKGFSICTVRISPSPSNWSYTGGVNSGTHYIGTTTSKVSFAGATNTAPGSVTLTVNPINVSGNLSATSVVSNNLNSSRTDSFSLGKTVQPYINPSISQLSIDRDTTQISLNYSVDTVNKTAIVEDSSVTVTKNPITIYYTITNMDTAVSTNRTYTLVADGNSLTNISDNLTFSVSGVTLDDNTRYKIEAYLEDRLGQTSNTLTYILPAAFQYIDILPLTSLNGPGIAFGKTATVENAVVFTEDLRPTIENSRAIVNPSSAADQTFFTAKRIANPNSTVYFGIGSGGVHRGIYLDNTKGAVNAANDNGAWLIYSDGDGVTHLPASDIRLAGHSSAVGSVINEYMTANKSVPNSSTAGTNLLSFVLPVGTWVVTAGVRFASNSTGYRVMNVSTTSGQAAWDFCMTAPNATCQMRNTWILSPTTDTPYYLNALQTSGAALNAVAVSSGTGTFVRAVRIL